MLEYLLQYSVFLLKPGGRLVSLLLTLRRLGLSLICVMRWLKGVLASDHLERLQGRGRTAARGPDARCEFLSGLWSVAETRPFDSLVALLYRTDCKLDLS